MDEPVALVLVKLCAFLIGLVAIAVLFQITTTQSYGATESPTFSTPSSSPNVIARKMAGIGSSIGSGAVAVQRSVGNGLHVTFGGGMHSAVAATSYSASIAGRMAVGSVWFFARGIGETFGFMGRSVVATMTSTVGFFSNVGGAVTNTAAMSSIIRPSENSAVPEISTPDIVAEATHDYVNSKAMPPPTPVMMPVPTPKAAAVAAPSAGSAGAQWPIHGTVTLPFGADDMPFELHHTGIDISDGKPAGVTPIHPFKPGKVKNIGCMDAGYGNCVIVDNGSGVNSWYAHMSSISVSVGQQVDDGTVLGYEGETGDATGVHLHFEIRFNNIPVNPQNYIQGNP